MAIKKIISTSKQTKRVANKTYITNRPDYNQTLAWNFGRMDTGGKFACSLQKLHQYTQELIKCEGITIENLLKRRHNHPVSPIKLSDEARRRLQILNLDLDTLFQLDLGTPVRLWGILEQNIFYIIWLDVEHSVYK